MAPTRLSRLLPSSACLTLRGTIRAISHTDSKPRSTPSTHYLDEDEFSRQGVAGACEPMGIMSG